MTEEIKVQLMQNEMLKGLGIENSQKEIKFQKSLFGDFVPYKVG